MSFLRATCLTCRPLRHKVGPQKHKTQLCAGSVSHRFVLAGIGALGEWRNHTSVLRTVKQVSTAAKRQDARKLRALVVAARQSSHQRRPGNVRPVRSGSAPAHGFTMSAALLESSAPSTPGQVVI